MPKRVTINDVARDAGVSKSAVSNALSGRGRVAEATRERVVQAAERLGWQPRPSARGLSKSRSYNVGIVFSRDAATMGADPFFAPFIAGVEDELSRHGYALMLSVDTDGHESELRNYRTLHAEARVDGVVLTDLLVGDPRIPLLGELGMPFVILGKADVPDVPVVYNDENDAVALVVSRLVELGHRHICHVTGPEHFVHARARRRSFTRICQKHGVRGTIIDGDFTMARGATATREALALGDRPTAIVYANSLMAIAGLRELTFEGVRVPDDVSIASLDDNPFADYLSPPLAAVHPDNLQMGVLCAQRLIELIQSSAPHSRADSIILRNPLLERGSLGPAPS